MNIKNKTEFVEFKLSLSQMSRALESIAAMLNKHGKGIVYFGVDDNGNIKGLSLGNKTLKDISNEITTRIKPQIIPSITTEEYESKVVVKVEVSGNNKPYSANGNYVIRSGSENKKIDPELMKDLLFSNSNETITSMQAINQDLTFNQLKQLFVVNNLTIDNQTFEKNCGLQTADGHYNVLGEILADNNDYSIKVVRFAGYDKSKIISRNEYGYKCLILSMQNCLNYVESLNETRVILDGELKRKEIHLFNNKCLREAWVNACLHSKWSKMIPPAIYIFNDRIEIISTGGLPIDYEIDDFYLGISRPVNKQLQKIMGQLGIVEQTGHGVPEIIKNYGKEAFKITDNYIVVTLKFPFELEKNSNITETLSSSHLRVFNAIKNQPTILTRELVNVTGIGISRINVIIKELKGLGIIERVGSNKNGYWKVVK